MLLRRFKNFAYDDALLMAIPLVFPIKILLLR
jgi:hypothetical protein